MNLVASSISFLNSLMFCFVSALNFTPLLSSERSDSDVRYMSLRTLLTFSAGRVARVPCCLTCAPMSPISAATAGTTSGVTCLVRT